MQLYAHWNPRVKTTSKIAAGRSLTEGILDIVLLIINSLTLNSQNGVNELQTTHNDRFTALWPGLPGQAGTRWNTHPPAILIIIQSLSASSIYHDPQHPPCSNYVLCNLIAQSLSPLWSTSWSGALHLIFHAFLHPISVFFSEHMPIPSQPVLL